MYLEQRGQRLEVELHRGKYDPDRPHGNQGYYEALSRGTCKTWQGQNISSYVHAEPGEYFYILIKWIGRNVDRETFDPKDANALAVTLDIEDGKTVQRGDIYIRFDHSADAPILGGLVHNFKREELEEEKNSALVNTEDYVEQSEAAQEGIVEEQRAFHNDKLYMHTFAIDGIHISDDHESTEIMRFKVADRDGHEDIEIREEDLDSCAPSQGSVTVSVRRVNVHGSNRMYAFTARADQSRSIPTWSDRDLIASGIPLKVEFEDYQSPIDIELPASITGVKNSLVGNYTFLIRPHAQFDQIKAEQPGMRMETGLRAGIVESERQRPPYQSGGW